MPLPVLLGGAVAAIYWTAVRAAIVSFLRWAVSQLSLKLLFQLGGVAYFAGVAKEWWDQSDAKNGVIEALNASALELLRLRTGIELDPADPFSVASLSAGISGKIGVQLTDITDREAVLHDVGKEIAKRINLEMGTQFDSVWPVTNLRDNLKNECLLAVQNGLVGGHTFLPVETINQIKTMVREHDGVFITRTEKRDRERSLARARQRKYAMTHKRIGGTWVER